MAGSSQNNPLTYMDGVYVKISENYKPPKRIPMVMSYSQRLALNKLIQEPILNYDFSKEESIKSKIFEWKKARAAILEQRKQRLTKLNNDVETSLKSSETEVNDTKNQTETVEDINKSDKKVSNDPYYQKSDDVLLPVVKSDDKLLTPQTIHVETCLNKNYVKNTQINYSEFETDTSSPFDNMELKTLNDFEELAQVLKPERNEFNSLTNQNQILQKNKNTENTYQKLFNNHFSSLNDYKNGFYNNTHMQISSSVEMNNDSTNLSFRSVKEIMKSLQDDLENATQINQDDIKSNATVASAVLNSPASNNSKDDLDNPFNNLNNELQNMARTISSMGFPLPRVARACQLLEGNQKKVITNTI